MGKKSKAAAAAPAPAVAVAIDQMMVKKRAVSKSERAGLCLASSRATTYLKQSSARASGAAGVFLTAAIESVLSEVINDAIGFAEEGGSQRIGVTAVTAGTRTGSAKRAFSSFAIVTDRVLPRPGNLLLTSRQIAAKKKIADNNSTASTVSA